MLPLHLIQQASALQSHSPITIDGNAGFTALNGVNSGTGTAADPYIIEGWDIVPAPYFNNAITVSDTTAYFIIRNITTHTLGVQFQNVTHFTLDTISTAGLFFGNVRNGVIERITSPTLSIAGTYCRGYCPSLGGADLTIANSVINNLHIDHSQNLTITGNNISGSKIKGIDMDQSSNITITNNTISSNMDDGIAFFGYNITVSNNNITANVGNGLSPNGVNIRILRNHFSHNGPIMPGVPIRPTTGLWLGGTNVTLQNNIFDSDGIIGAPSVVAPNYFIESGNLANGKPIIFFHDCQGVNVDSVPVGQLLIANCSHIRISNIQVLNTADGLQMSSVHDAIISGSDFSMNKRNGISILSSTSVTILNDSIVGNGGDGISLGPSGPYVVRSGRVTIKDSNVGNNGDSLHVSQTGAGIRLDADNCTLTGNVIYSNLLSGMLLGGTNFTITSNKVTANGGTYPTNSNALFSEWSGGISVALGQPASQWFWISANNISRNFVFGVGVFWSQYVNVTRNLIVSNQAYGIVVSHSYPGPIYNNNLINNWIDAVEVPINQSPQYLNSWNLTYPAGGNYWSDYTGSDKCSGPKQDQCNIADNIGDTPKTLFACVTESNYLCGNYNATDPYPLMKPYGFSRDTDPPTWPNATLRVTQATTNSIVLAWAPAVDQIGAIRYAIYEGNNKIATLKGSILSYTVSGLTAGTPYSFHVEAMDPWGNWSTNGPSVNASTTGWWQYWYLVVVVIAGVGTAAFLHWKGWLRLWRRSRITLSKRPAQVSKGCWLSGFFGPVFPQIRGSNRPE
ncbi:MAG: hypothetical protein AUG17_05740 [Crenarchaeota archaeon 13_1_20CM_2_53_14]|nr:MAG: hypothetical protein AUG17_05740 [Crenarchaeota archaeon 13_1_20CM_2_53_14]